MSVQQCSYCTSLGQRCPNPAETSEFCFWHDENIDKTGPDIKQKLEEYTHDGGFTLGIKLKRAQLQGINLVNHGSKEGYDFSECDLYHANMQESHLFNINFNRSSLMKADLSGANLHFANLTGTNLLGIKLNDSRIEHLQLPKRISQEVTGRAALKKGDMKTALDHLEQAEEIYRDLRKAAEQQGLFEYSGRFIHRELIMRRLQKPFYSRERFTSKMVDLFCGYGEKPVNVVIFSLLLIALCACFYFIFGVRFSDEYIGYQADQTIFQNIKLYFSSLYFSVVTFTTLGYGDITPIGFSRLVAAIEAFIGSFTLALFVVVFVKKMTR